MARVLAFAVSAAALVAPPTQQRRPVTARAVVSEPIPSSVSSKDTLVAAAEAFADGVDGDGAGGASAPLPLVSAKTKMVLQAVRAMLADDADAKCLVFSCDTKARRPTSYHHVPHRQRLSPHLASPCTQYLDVLQETLNAEGLRRK